MIKYSFFYPKSLLIYSLVLSHSENIHILTMNVIAPINFEFYRIAFENLISNYHSENVIRKYINILLFLAIFKNIIAI